MPEPIQGSNVESDLSDSQGSNSNTLDDDELVVVLDGYNGDWTPTAVMTDSSEAIRLREMLSEDAPAHCSIASWFDSKQDVIEGNTSAVPDQLPDEISVCFLQDTVFGVSDDDFVTRQMAIENESGLRKTVGVFDTAQAVVDENPAVSGQFIDHSGNAADDLIDSIE